jgi:3-hydroxyisobutyrate dehydrogenase-like beta-hydroxyacid dehydrogenase
MDSPIGFIGLGVMGSRMSRNLLRGGHRVIVYNRSRAAVEELAGQGAIAAASPEEVARACRVVVLSLSDSRAVEEVVLGERGLAGGLATGSVVVDTSTIEPSVSAMVAAKLRERGSRFLDAPVSGGPERASTGTLSIMVGGDRAAFAECEGVLRCMGDRIFYLGESGSGLRMKLFNQALVGVYFVAVAEAYLWSQRLGVGLEDLERVISTSWGDSPPFRHFVAVLRSGEFRGGALIRNLEKDLSIVLGSAREEGVSLSLAELAYQYAAEADEMGRGEDDMASIFRVLDEIKARRAGGPALTGASRARRSAACSRPLPRAGARTRRGGRSSCRRGTGGARACRQERRPARSSRS